MPGTRHIVIADDHTLVRRAVRRILDTLEDFRVVGEAADGEEAVELVRRQHPDAVVLDFEMPKLNGLEAARQIRQLPSPPKVIVLTMYQNDALVFKAFEAGCIGYVTKNAAPNELTEAVREAVEGRFFLSKGLRHLSAEIEQRRGS